MTCIHVWKSSGETFSHRAEIGCHIQIINGDKVQKSSIFSASKDSPLTSGRKAVCLPSLCSHEKKKDFRKIKGRFLGSLHLQSNRAWGPSISDTLPLPNSLCVGHRWLKKKMADLEGQKSSRGFPLWYCFGEVMGPFQLKIVYDSKLKPLHSWGCYHFPL